MGFRFRKSTKIAPGVKLNLGKKSVGVSVGNQYGGISYNSETGTKARVSAPGTGVSYTTGMGKTPHNGRRGYKRNTPLVDRLLKPVLIVCVCIIVICVSVITIVSKKEAAQKQTVEDAERRAIATAMVALDQYAPSVDYDSDLTSADNWLVSFNADGTVTVRAPEVYGEIAVMLTGSDGEYAPYFVSVNGEELLNIPQ